MKCPACAHEDTKVVDSRVATDGFSIRRRRECLKCSFRFSTYEEMEILNLTIVKRDGRKESYSRDKLVKGLKRALEKRPITDDDFKKLVNFIERDLQLFRTSEITSAQVGQVVMQQLRVTDPVAYIRYASVYESFKDARTFQEELNKLLRQKRVRVVRGKKKS